MRTIIAAAVLAAAVLPSAAAEKAPIAAPTPVRMAKVDPTMPVVPDADNSPRLHVSTYRVALLPSLDPDATFATRTAQIRKALEGGSQTDARQRLAALGDVTTVLPKVLVDTSDDEANTITLSNGSTTYVKSMASGGAHDGEGTLGHVRSANEVRFEQFPTAKGIETFYVAKSTHLKALDRFEAGGRAVDLPNVETDVAKGSIDLAKGALAPVTVQDSADSKGHTVIVYVVSQAD